MILTFSQLHDLSEVIFGLMTGVYDLDVFVSPYNALIQNEFSLNNGRAVEAYSSIYTGIESLQDLLNKLKNDSEEDKAFDCLRNSIDDLLKEICTSAIAIGYLVSKGYVTLDIKEAPYEKYFRLQFIREDGIGYRRYNQLISAMERVRKLFIDLGDKDNGVEEFLEMIQDSIEQEYSILTHIAYSHGESVGNGTYPLWLENEGDRMNKTIQQGKVNVSKEMLLAMYHDPCSIFENKLASLPYTNKVVLLQMKGRDELERQLPSDLKDLFNKTCFYQSLTNQREIDNAFYHGFQFGLNLAVEVLHK